MKAFVNTKNKSVICTVYLFYFILLFSSFSQAQTFYTVGGSNSSTNINDPKVAKAQADAKAKAAEIQAKYSGKYTVNEKSIFYDVMQVVYGGYPLQTQDSLISNIRNSLIGHPEVSYQLKHDIAVVHQPIQIEAGKQRAIAKSIASSGSIGSGTTGQTTTATKPPTVPASSTGTNQPSTVSSNNSNTGLGGVTYGWETDPFSQQTPSTYPQQVDPLSQVLGLNSFNIDDLLKYSGDNSSAKPNFDQYIAEMEALGKTIPKDSTTVPLNLDANGDPVGGIQTVSLPPGATYGPPIIVDGSSGTSTVARAPSSTSLLDVSQDYITEQLQKLKTKSQQTLAKDLLKGSSSEKIKDDLEAVAKAQLNGIKDGLVQKAKDKVINTVATNVLGPENATKAIKGVENLKFVYELATQTQGYNRDQYAHMAAGMAAQMLLKFIGGLCPTCKLISLALEAVLPKLIARMYSHGCDNARFTRTLTCRMGQAETDNVFWEIQKISWKGLKRRCKWNKTVGWVAPASDEDILNEAKNNSIDFSKWLNLDMLLGDETMSDSDALDFFKGIDNTNNLSQLYFPGFDGADSGVDINDMTDLSDSMRRNYLDKEYSLWAKFHEKIVTSLQNLRTDFSSYKDKSDLLQEQANNESKFKQMDALFAEYLQYKKAFKDIKIVRDNNDTVGVMRDVEEAFMVGYQQRILAKKNLEEKKSKL